MSACDRAGNFIGWLFVDDVNLSLSLVKVGNIYKQLVSALSKVVRFFPGYWFPRARNVN